MFAALVVGCADTSAPDEPTARLAASERSTAELGVTRWDVVSDGERARITGRDAADTALVELIAERDTTSDRRIHIDVVSPQAATFDLADDGTLAGADAQATAIGLALHADLAHATRPLPVPGGDGYGSVSSALSTWREGHIDLGWSFFGYSGYQYVSDWCTGHVRSEQSDAMTQWGIAQANLEWQSFIVSDCRAKVNYSIPGWHWDTAFWWVMIDS